jgi:hypothetical protein
MLFFFFYSHLVSLRFLSDLRGSAVILSLECACMGSVDAYRARARI